MFSLINKNLGIIILKVIEGLIYVFLGLGMLSVMMIDVFSWRKLISIKRLCI